MDGPGYSLGIDENGLGPRLGPLIVTAVIARISADGARVAHSRPKGKFRQRLGDSKALVSFGDSILGEAWAREVMKRSGVGEERASVDDLVHALSIDAKGTLRASCPSDHLEQCWNTAGENLGADKKLLGQVARDLDKLAAAGVEIVGARIAIVCTKRLNDGVATGLSRFDVDLHTMERLVLFAREHVGQEIFATCGKVGGFDRYGERFGPMAGRLHVVLDEGRAKSVYKIPGIGTVAFVRDADATNLLVCMASLIGKWVRDSLMTRIVRYHRVHDPELPDASGYHDPVTTRFIDASALTRKKRNVPDVCFVRDRLGREDEEVLDLP